MSEPESSTTTAQPVRDPKDLKPHPLNAEIYNDTFDDDLLNSVRENGIVQPIVITPQGMIISGHRRHAAALFLGMKEVPVGIDESPEGEIVQRIIAANKNRKKTNVQKIREFIAMLEQARAKKTHGDGTDSHEEACRMLGVASRGKWARMKKIICLADSKRAAGDTAGADEIIKVINKSMDEAWHRYGGEVGTCSKYIGGKSFKIELIKAELDMLRAISEAEDRDTYPQLKRMMREKIKEEYERLCCTVTQKRPASHDIGGLPEDE